MDKFSLGFFIFYTVATGIFFLAQLYGFILSQTNYSDQIEDPKFKMLKGENIEWETGL